MMGQLGVRGRLLLACLGISGFSILAAAAGLYAFQQVGERLSLIDKRVPIVASSMELSRSALRYAAWAADEAPDELPVAAGLARDACSEAFFRVAADTIQVHGGIGFTWEHDAHLYFKRAKASELLLGDPAHHRELMLRRIGI